MFKEVKFKISFFLVVFTTLSFISSCFAHNENIGNLYSNYLKGAFFAKEGNYEAALEELKKAKRLDPFSIRIRLKIVNLLIYLNQIEKAEKELREAKRIEPENLDVSLALIFLYSYAQNDTKLEKEYGEFLEKVHKIKPEDIKISEYLAQFYLYKKNPTRAIKVYEAILEHNPDYVEGIFGLGYLYEEAGKRKEAIKAWQRLLTIDPHHAPTLNSLGYIYAEEGINLDEAQQMIEEALRKEPENGAYWDSLGWVYFKKKDYTKAEESLKKAISYLKDPVIYEHIGDLYIELGNLKEGIKNYQEGLSYFPNTKSLQEKVNKYGGGDKISKE